MDALTFEVLRNSFATAVDEMAQSVCRHVEEELHPLEATAAVASVLYDVTAREAWLTDGPPCCSSYSPLVWPSRKAAAPRSG